MTRIKIIPILALLFSNSTLFELKAQEYHYADLQTALKNKQAVRELVIWGERVGNELYEFENLEYLLIEEANIDSITVGIIKLSKLKHVRIRSSNLCYVSPELFKLDSLVSLNLSSNSLTSLNIEEGNSNLKQIDLSYNELQDISFLSKFKGLEQIYCRDCKLTEIPKKIFTPTLTELLLIENNIKAIPEEIIKAINLKTLRLQVNDIRELPNGLFYLCNLEHLELWRNQLKAFDKRFRLLKNLKRLDLQENNIVNIENEITFEKLEILFIGYNEIDISQRSVIKSKNQDFKIIW